MNTIRALARVPGGRRTKWLVLVFWLLVVAAAGPLAGKLTNAAKNDPSAWLPAKAESTQVVNLQAAFQSPKVFTGVIVYSRPGGLTAAEPANAARRARGEGARRRALLRRRAGGGPRPGRRAGCEGRARTVRRSGQRMEGRRQ